MTDSPPRIFVIVGADGRTVGMPYVVRAGAARGLESADEDRPSAAPHRVVEYASTEAAKT